MAAVQLTYSVSIYRPTTSNLLYTNMVKYTCEITKYVILYLFLDEGCEFHDSRGITDLKLNIYLVDYLYKQIHNEN